MIRVVLRATVVLYFGLLASTVSAFDTPLSRANAAGGTIRLRSTTASGLLALPVGGLSQGRYSIEAGFQRQFDLSELDQVFLAGAWRWRSLTFSFGMSQLGKTDYYSERVMKAGGAMHLDSLALGLTLSGKMVDIGSGYGQLRAAGVGGCLSYRRGRWFVAAMADDLNSPRLVEHSEAILPTYNFFGELLAKGSTALSVRATFQKKEKPQFGMSQSLKLSRAAELFVGLSSQPMKYGAGINIQISNTFFTYASSVHPVLGLTHTVTLGYGNTVQRQGDFR